MNDQADPQVLIGRRDSDHLLVSVRPRLRPESDDFWDGNWLSAEMVMAAGGFRGRVAAALRIEDFAAFREGLSGLYESLGGEARFATMEGWLEIVVEGDGRGHFTSRCEAVDVMGIAPNRLTFWLSFDQTQIPAILAGLDDILGRFPPRGGREAE